MELNKEEENSAADFTGEIQTNNIWATQEDDDESDIPSFLRRRKRNKKD